MTRTQLKKLEAKAIKLICQIYRMPGGQAGGPLHIVLDDGNTEDRNVQWCIDNIDSHDCSIVLKQLCRECAEILIQLPERRRDAINRQAWREMHET